MRAPSLIGAAGLVAILTLTEPGCATPSSTPAETALLQGRVGDAERLLRADLSARPNDARDHLLLCRVFYAQNRFDEAEGEGEAANATETSQSELWLGRVYGARASVANPLHAFALARKVHAAFERAAELDPHNVAALSDLGQFYVEAPAVVGGGLDKARLLAEQLAAIDPVAGHHLRGLIAQKADDLVTAKQEFEAAAASGSPAALIDLAIFRERQKETESALSAVRQAISADHARDASLVDAATLITRLHGDSQLAVRVLRSYLASPAVSDAAPTFKVRLQLADILRAMGDTTGAEHEAEISTALAPAYAAERKRKSDGGL